MKLAAIGLAALASLAVARPAAAEDPSALIAKARREMLDLNYDRAIQLLEQAETTGRNQPEEIVAIYRLLGESQAALGHRDAAESEFRRLLALDPTAALPPGSSPKLKEPFQAARSAMSQSSPLTVTCERSGKGLVMTITSDPLDQVASGRATSGGAPVTEPESTSSRTRIPLSVPAGAPRALDCSALDRHGNELVRASPNAAVGRQVEAGRGEDDPTSILPPGEEAREQEPDAVPAPGSTAPIDEPEGPGPPLYARWWLWGSGAVAAAGVGAYFAVLVQNDADEWRELKKDSQNHEYQEALAVQERGERRALYTNIAFGTSVALAVVSTVLLIRQTDRPAATAGVSAGPLPERGAAATFWLRF
jgi:tetratricopeptide (TPR) repeat protein